MTNHKLSLRLVLFPAVVVSTCLVIASLHADPGCGSCPKSVTVTGKYEHGVTDPSVEIQGVGADEAVKYRDDLHGQQFTVSVADLPAGKYTAVFGEIELGFYGPGMRLFDIWYGTNVLAANVDIFSVAGAASKPCQLTAQVEHPGGALSFTFTGVKGDAELNTFELRDETNGLVASATAKELAPAGDTNAAQAAEAPVLWRDASLALEVRVKDLVGRMTLMEKVAQMRNQAPPIPRLGLPAYNYWNECLHGVGRAGIATVFPQAIGMAAMWDTPLLHDVADVIATEARAKHNEYVNAHHGDCAQYYGLNFWTPNINIFRDPRWGRGQETYGEDTFLTARMAVAFIQGLQGDDPNYYKAVACAKHFAVHSGPETSRHTFDADPPERDFYETYLPHFEAAVREGHVGGVMGAYNAVYGEPACSSALLLTDLLRKQWGFQGYVVSDCGAIQDIYAHHKTVRTVEQAAARAVKAGCDLCCGGDYNSLWLSVNEGLITEPEIDKALSELLAVRFRLGMFDPPERVEYAHIPIEKNDSPQHQLMALRAARESIVLLKNKGLLPLDRAKYKRIAVIGANADAVGTLLGNYNGEPSSPVTILSGIQMLTDTNTTIYVVKDYPLASHRNETNSLPGVKMTNALAAAKLADVVIYVGGLDPDLECEERPVNFDGFKGGDRTRIELPRVQDALLRALYATGKPVVFVNCSGSAVAMPWEAAHLPAIVQAWYPGEVGGRAVAEVLFGDTNPAGRLPVTFYASTSDLPAFDSYSMSNRTYRYFSGKPMYAFGHGLSYTRFKYSSARVEEPTGTNDYVRVQVNVRNTGNRDGDEVVQVYFRHVKSAVPQPRQALCGFTRVHVRQGDIVPVMVDVPLKEFRYWDTTKKRYIVESGKYQILVGAASDDIRAKMSLKIAATE